MHFLAIRRGSTKPGDPRQAQIVTLRAATHGNDVVVANLSVAEDAPGEKTHDLRQAKVCRRLSLGYRRVIAGIAHSMPAILPDYLADLGRDMAAKSAAISHDLATIARKQSKQ